MRGFGDLIQKAVYLGVGLASYAGEKAGTKLSELRTEAQKLADELVRRGEMTTEEARRFVDDTIRQAQQPGTVETQEEEKPSEPRRIEILDDEEASASDDSVDKLRQQVKDLQEELRRLQRE